METMDDLIDEGVHGVERAQAGLPAEYRCRLVHARHGYLAERARLDEQHLPPRRREELQQPHVVLRHRHPPGRLHPAGRRARRQDGRLDGVGRDAQPACPPLQGPVVDFRTFFSDRGVLLNYDMPGQPAGANAFGVAYQRVVLDRRLRVDERARDATARRSRQQLKVTNTAFPAADNVDRLYDLYIYDSMQRGRKTTTVCSSCRRPRARTAPSALPTLAPGEWADIKVS